ncbi:MAG: DUF92 domain-containing protein [Candidatus Eremiobacteraeota bacterium]|nr:DUF92 domain-containing protein [Candidatus Eremiobacteraeota bacterium]
MKSRALTRDGTIAAACVGLATLLGFHLIGALVLFAFFLPSIALSKLPHPHPERLRDIDKQGARDAWQVVANGGVAGVAGIIAFIFPQAHAYAAAAFVGAFAAASADTWGTEIGTRFGANVRSILTFRREADGLSGGVTTAGTLAEIAGALVVAASAALFSLAPLAAGTAGGIVGAFADSYLGASVQERRYCRTCARACESDPHACGAPTQRVRGVRGFRNDAVNFSATLVGALTGLAFLALATRYFP